MSNKTSDKNVGSIKRLKQMVEIIPTCDFPKFQMDYDNALLFANDIENILAEREQKDERIKELEEELEKANRQLDLDYVEENFIPKQVIKDKIEKIIKETTPTPVFKPKSMWDDTDYERLYKTQPLLELLEGGSK